MRAAMWWPLLLCASLPAAIMAASAPPAPPASPAPPAPPPAPCAAARLRCAYRRGCGSALNNYMLLCADVLSAPAAACPEPCQHALIALTSTEEGKELMTCRCEDDYCAESKQRMEVCRGEVVRAARNVTSCRLSQLICLADAECATALEYYHRLCRSMYQGRKCSYKCLNSIAILREQERAAALTNCTCDGYEDYDCPRMQSNLERLCFHKHKKHHKKVEAKTAAAAALAPGVLLVMTLLVT